MKKIRLSISKKISIYSIGLISILLVVSYVFNMFFIDSIFINDKKKELPLIVNIVEDFLLTNKKSDLEKYINDIKEKRGITIFIMNKNFKKWENKKGGFGNGFSMENLKSEDFFIKNKRRTGSKILVYNQKIKTGQWISARISLTFLNTYKSDLLYFNISGIILAVIISLIVSRIWVKKLLKDIEILNRKAKDISNLNFNKNNIIKRDDEIGDLGKGIEKMSINLESSIKQLEEFISNVSHELKTPISIISSNIQLLMNEKKIDLITEEKYRNILKESYYTKILIEKLMRLSKLENQKKIEYKFINLNKIIEEILERYDYIELAKNLEIKLDTLKNKYFINEDMFRIALDNIILNSMKYSKDNGILKIYEKDKTLFFENEILKEFSLDNLFNPFVRGSNSSREDGTGLGLTLIKKILELNNINYGIELKNKKFIFWIK